MALLATQNINLNGLAPAYVAANAGGDTFVNPQGANAPFAHIKNGSASAITVTVTRQITSANVQGEGSVPLANLSVSIPANSDKMIGPFPQTFNNASGQVALAYSAVASVTVAVINQPVI